MTAQGRDIIIGIEPAVQPEVEELIALSDAYSLARYPAEGHFGSSLDELDDAGIDLAVLRLDGAAVGCGALKWSDDGSAELKRLFVREEGRGTGAGRRLMDFLEDLARQRGAGRINLETGPLNREAVSLYRALGYGECGPFPPYEVNPYSLFMTKQLAN